MVAVRKNLLTVDLLLEGNPSSIRFRHKSESGRRFWGKSSGQADKLRARSVEA